VTWTADESALGLLDRHGGPYESASYRRACAEAVPRLRDRSFGGRAADGATAAVALMISGRQASSMPYGYGGVHASRPLAPEERFLFLSTARRAAGAWSLRAIFLGDAGDRSDAVGSTRFVDVRRPPAQQWDSTAVHKLRRLQRRGCTCSASPDPGEFLPVHRVESAHWGVRYPESLVHAAAKHGIARFYSVRDSSGTVVSVLAALLSPTHWVYWFGAQTDAGRTLSGSYLSMATMLEDAHRAGVAGVNLGASAGLPGVHAFKSRWGGRELPVCSLRIGIPGLSAVADAAARLASRRH